MKIRAVVLILVTLTLSSCNRPEQQYQGYVEGENIYLASPFAGTLIKLNAQRGQHVKKGDLLFMLDPNPQDIVVDEANASVLQASKQLRDLEQPRRPAEIAAIQAQISQAEAQVELAEIRAKRNQILYNKHVLDKDSLDASLERHQELLQVKAQFQANLDLARQGARLEQINAQKAQIQALTAKANEAKWELSQKQQYAPDDGLIFDTYFRTGEFVTAQRPVLSLLTPTNTRIEFFVPLNDLNTMYVGQPIDFSCENCKKMKRAVITYISPEAEYAPPLVYSRDNDKKLVFRVKASVKTPREVIPGQPVIVYVASEHNAARRHN